MITRRTIFFFAALAISFAQAGCAAGPNDPPQVTEPVVLRVALYPYVPLRRDLFLELEQVFERNHPGVNVELVESSDLNWDYYSGGLQKVVADVYEIDTVLLSDLIALGKIGPIDLPENGFTESSLEAVTRRGQIYAVPHWMCGNFLFFRKGDSDIENASSWRELLNALETTDKRLILDLKGESTLGEWYLTLLSGRLGMEAAQQAVMREAPLDGEVVSLLKRVLASCPEGYCRSDDLHDRAGFYARRFIRGEAAAYIGYSEALHYGLQEFLSDCTAGSQCVPEQDIGIRRLPPIVSGDNDKGIGWVDGLAIDAAVKGRKREIAEAFIAFLVSDEGYRLVLEPEWGEAPRYLLPARRIHLPAAPLYSTLLSEHDGRRTGTAQGLNEKLRILGQKLDCALPIEPGDTKTLNACKDK